MSEKVEITGRGLAELVVLARAAHIGHDRAMKAAAIDRLRLEYGVCLTFRRDAKPREGVAPC